MTANGMPSIFIGASSEANELTEQLVAALTGGGDVHVVPWFDAFDLGFSALEDLAARIEEVDFAALLLVPDDKVTRRQAQHDVPRDNVVFELGLFMGKLSRTRAFALVEEGVTLPSDLQGVTVVRFQRDAIGAAAERITKRMRDLGPAPRVPLGAHIVDCGREGRNVHSTIASAVAAAAPNDVVLVRPGTYAEQIVVDKPLEIIGMGVMGEQHRPVLRSSGACAVTYRATNGVGRISSLQIEGGGDGACASVDVPAGHLVLDGCEIGTVGAVEASVRVRRDGFARVVGNRITCGTGIGLLVCERGDADVCRTTWSRVTRTPAWRCGTAPGRASRTTRSARAAAVVSWCEGRTAGHGSSATTSSRTRSRASP